MVSLASITFALTIATATASADTITASLFSPQPPSGGTPVAIELSGITAPSSSMITGAKFTVAFSAGSDQGEVQGNVDPGHAVPMAGVTGSNVAESLTGDYDLALTSD